MLRFHRTTVALSALLLSASGFALAGDPKAAAPGAVAKSGECACAACGLYQADLDTLVAKIAAGEAPAEFCKDAKAEKVAWLQRHPEMFFSNVLRSRPSDLEAAFAKLEARFADKAASDAERGRMLDVVVCFPQKANAKLTLALWKTAPAAFRTEHLTALASYGPEPIVAALKERAKSEVLAAAYFGVRGDECGKKTLAAAAKKLDLGQGELAQPALAALGLAGLGDRKPLEKLQGTLRDAALEALDKGEVAHAGKLAMIAEFVGKLDQAGARAELGWFATSLEIHCAERCHELAGADDVFQALEALRT